MRSMPTPNKKMQIIYPNRVTCHVNHPIAPPERHNFIELPHETHFAKDPQGNKNKPRTEAWSVGPTLLSSSHSRWWDYSDHRCGCRWLSLRGTTIWCQRCCCGKWQFPVRNVQENLSGQAAGRIRQDRREIWRGRWRSACHSTPAAREVRSACANPSPRASLSSSTALRLLWKDITTDDISTDARCIECTGIQGYLCAKCTSHIQIWTASGCAKPITSNAAQNPKLFDTFSTLFGLFSCNFLY